MPLVDVLGDFEVPRGEAPFGDGFSVIEDRLELVGVPGFLGVADMLQRREQYVKCLLRWICDATQGGGRRKDVGFRFATKEPVNNGHLRGRSEHPTTGRKCKTAA